MAFDIGFLANLLAAGAWLFPLFALPPVVFVISIGHGPWGLVVGLVLTLVLLGGPSVFPVRAGLYLGYLALALTSAIPGACLCAVVMGGFMYMMTEIPGRPRAFAPNEAFTEFLAANGPSYYAAHELRGAVDEIKPGKNMFAAHPHGILSAGWTWNLFFNLKLHERTGRIGFLIDENLRLRIPTFRCFCDWFESKDRFSAPATRKVIKECMQRGESLAILPGGFQEAVLCAFGKDRVYMKKRQGFVKYCLQSGYRITPAYTFGESDTYWTFRGLIPFRLWLGGHNIPAAAMFGNPICPILPLPSASIITFVGPPIELPQIDEPTREEVDKWHRKYMEAVIALFDKHKAEVGKPDAELEVF